MIDLKAQLARGDAKHLYRYLPLTLNDGLRDWLRSAIKQGQASDIRMALSGDLSDFPFTDSKKGQFLITFKAANAVLDYAPGWPEVTEIVGVGQTRDFEFVAVPGDWAFHCHMSHHTMNAMGHEIPNTLGVDQKGLEEKIRKLLPGYMAMGEKGMADMQDHSKHMAGPKNTIPMMMGKGPFGNLEMGGMFTVLKVRDNITSYEDPGWYQQPPGTAPRLIKEGGK